ncbi:MAG: porphobilinogen synthase [archaeon]|nr:porphobilinogen synthase [archaeon]
MKYPEVRMRRLRRNRIIEDLVAETSVASSDFILPLFFDENISTDRPVASMPGVVNHPLSRYEQVGSSIEESGVKSVIVFGTPKNKDMYGSQASLSNGVSQRAIRGLKDNSNLVVISDLCMCEYTDHGHCGIVHDGVIDNDKTLLQYGKIAVSQAEAGADIIAPSGMMDGQVSAIRMALDDANFSDVLIMAYSAKYCSSFYGPFRDAVNSSFKGDRSTYQMQCSNSREAMREIALDVNEGADIIMIKPALPYMDIIHEARNRFDNPIAAYQVSGEYAMIQAAAANNWIDGDHAMMESLISIKRAGADMIITYFAEKAAEELRRML